MNQEEVRRCWISQPPKPGETVRSLKIANETRWNRSDLRRWMAAGLASMHVSLYRSVRVYRARQSGDGHHGWGYYSSRTAELGIPNPGEEKVDWRKAAQIFEHEIQHNLGLHHRDMPHWWNLPVPWWNSVEVRAKPERQSAVPKDRDAERLVTIEAAISRWQRKERLAKTKLSAWRRKLKYIEKRRAALSRRPAAPETGDE